MQRPIKPEWLLRQANDLAKRGSPSAGQPRNADLRRAASAAYYALFHHIVLGATEHFLPSCSEDDRYRFARHYQHFGVRQVCDWVVGPKAPPGRVRATMLQLRNHQPIVDVALSFQGLQVSRHDADYNHLADFSKPETLTLIDSAEDAIAKLDGMWNTAPYENFVAHLLLRSTVT